MAIKSKKTKLGSRDRRKLRIRRSVEGTGERPRLTVFKSSKYTYAELICDVTGKTIVSASSLESAVMQEVAAYKPPVSKKAAGGEKDGSEGKKAEEAAPRSKSSKSITAARVVGAVLAKRALEKKISQAVFDRNGFVYTGRVGAVADGARDGGLKL